MKKQLLVWAVVALIFTAAYFVEQAIIHPLAQ